MSRSAVREIQASGVSVHRGEVVVPTQIGDPVHGLLMGHAAGLVAGSLQAKGHRPRLAGLPRSDDPAGDFDARLYLVTCPQQDGSTAVIAAAAAPGDALCAAAARTAVEEWAAVCGTRTLLLAGHSRGAPARCTRPARPGRLLPSIAGAAGTCTCWRK